MQFIISSRTVVAFLAFVAFSFLFLCAEPAGLFEGSGLQQA